MNRPLHEPRLSRKRGAGETNILLPVKMSSKTRGIFSHIFSVRELPSLLTVRRKDTLPPRVRG
jgi:hypothetical protein